jgi:type I restriction enzyme S subunit
MELLEEATRLLYQEWFIRLRFPGHTQSKITDGIPEGWSREPLGQRAVLNYGKALKAEERTAGDIPVFGSSGIVGTHDKALTQGPGIIVGRKGNAGSVFWSSKDFYAIDTVYFINAAQSDLYLFYALKNMNFISTDGAVPGLNRDFAHSRPLLTPSEPIRTLFLENVNPIHLQIDKLEEMNKKLRVARDLLLPRLMSGEVPIQ